MSQYPSGLQSLKTVQTPWGSEETIFSADDYTVKLLRIKKFGTSGLHFSPAVKLIWRVLSGCVMVKMGRNRESGHLSSGQSVIIPPAEDHSFIGDAQESLLLEVSIYIPPLNSGGADPSAAVLSHLRPK